MGNPKQEKGGSRRKRDELSSTSSTSSQSSPEAKRLNDKSMAEPSEEEPKARYAQDPALAAIWEVLIRIEANTNQLIKDQKAMQENYEELKNSLEFTQDMLENVKTENAELKKKMDAVVENSSALQEKVSLLENNLASCENQRVSLEKNLNELSTMHDDLEQYTRKFNLEIQGIPEEREEDTQQIILDLARCLDISMEPKDIDICHRMRKGNHEQRPIIVRFSNYYSKEKMYQNRRKLRRVDVGRYLRGAEKVFINENLTARRANLFKKVRDKKRPHSEWRAWTLDGKIYVKKDPTDNSIIPIKSVEDLNKL